MSKHILVCGAGGFIGSHLVARLKSEGFWVRGADLELPEFLDSEADDFIVGDLRDASICEKAVKDCSEVYQFAADMGGIGFICGENDAEIMHNSAMINLNMLDVCLKNETDKIFYSSSACVYPKYNQLDPSSPKCTESSVYPAEPDSEYGWEKLFSERLYKVYARTNGLNVRIARLHNIFGPQGTWEGGREKAPAALCRKIAEAQDGGEIEVWGDGLQTRSFLYIDECLEGVRRLMDSDVTDPLNIGSSEMIAINDLAMLIADIAGKKVSIKNIPGPQGVRGRNSDNTLIREKLNWAPQMPLRDGLARTYKWIEERVKVASPVS